MHLHSVKLVEGNCPSINDRLWMMIEKNDRIEHKSLEKFEAKGVNGMVPCQSPKLIVNGDEVATGYNDIKQFISSHEVLRAAIEAQRAKTVGRSTVAAV